MRIAKERQLSTNKNSHRIASAAYTLCAHKLTPLSESGGSIELEIVS